MRNAPARIATVITAAAVFLGGKPRVHTHPSNTGLASRNAELHGIMSSSSVPGAALVSRNSPPNSLARCFMPPIPTPMLSGRSSAIFLSIPLPSSSTDATMSPSLWFKVIQTFCAPEFPRLTPEVETAIFRIIQEALTNVFRHSGAQKVWITLNQRDGLIVASVLDDGKGIDKKIAELRPESIGVGIGGMKQRAKEFGGELRLTNAAPGTLLELMIPCSSALREASPVLGGCV